jgi:hypothetical protein
VRVLPAVFPVQLGEEGEAVLPDGPARKSGSTTAASSRSCIFKVLREARYSGLVSLVYEG